MGGSKSLVAREASEEASNKKPLHTCSEVKVF
jgi:hypothetical protein